MKTNSAMIGIRRKSAFTLVELLVVIVIIASLAALTLVVTTRVRAAAHNVTSISNLKNIGIGLAVVMADGPPGQGGGPGVFPSQKGTTDDKVSYMWPDLIGEALGFIEVRNKKFVYTVDPTKTIFQNPGRKLQPDTDPKFKNLDPENYEQTSSYGINYRLAWFNTWTKGGTGKDQTWFAKRGMDVEMRPRLMFVENPSQLVVVCESNGDGVSEQLVHPFGTFSIPADFNNGGCNAVFADGHVEWKSAGREDGQFREWQKGGGGRQPHSKYFDGTQGVKFGEDPP